MRSFGIFAKLLWGGTLLATTFSSPCLASGNHPETESEQLASIPGLSVKETFAALHAAILDGCGTPPCKRYYFPADLLAAAYDLHDEGRVFEPSRWRLWAPRLESLLAEAKRGTTPMRDLPEFLFMDLPGIGPHHYDCGLIRGLVGTQVFPYPMRIKFLREQGTSLPVVVLDSSAYWAKTCFSKITEDKHSCSDVVADLVRESGKTSSIPPQLSGQKSGAHFVPVDIALNPRSPSRAAGPDVKPQCEDYETVHPPLYYVLACIEGFGNREVGKPIEVSSLREKAQFHCDVHLDPNEREDVDKPGCIYRFALNFPTSTRSVYERVGLHILFPNQAVIACGPPSLGLPREPPNPIAKNQPCSTNRADFVVEGDALKAPQIPLSVYVRPDSQQDSTPLPLVLVLFGVDRGTSKRRNYGWWCLKGPNGSCGQDDRDILNQLREVH